MSRNTLYIVVGLLAAALIVIGYLYYQDSQKTHIGIVVGDDGITIDGN